MADEPDAPEPPPIPEGMDAGQESAYIGLIEAGMAPLVDPDFIEPLVIDSASVVTADQG